VADTGLVGAGNPDFLRLALLTIDDGDPLVLILAAIRLLGILLLRHRAWLSSLSLSHTP
jgi:hypothetical protein